MNAPEPVVLTAEDLPKLFSLFQKGVQTEVETGQNLKALLCEEWGLPVEYVTGRISTLFINGKPVDDLETVQIRAGVTLALSSAMPGLVGAVMRRGGYYSSLRSSISYHEGAQPVSHQRGRITVKLFNVLMGEMGGLLLQRGIWAGPADLEAIFPDSCQDRAAQGSIPVICPECGFNA
ncbi:hypothetical protein DENIS_0379 [Desulfonema ishimotonii]|uniref:Uncharacterized protein n=1 Tax=Desulfonema ishimotonii TaxID=45657 RepID=A0A401FR52_9BACT|nr:hypothetical protein [Desulfonema ishimotonii]GBC59440.1 hypothetical protein DENIS_0379 [Desulfonema ishimotonii]